MVLVSVELAEEVAVARASESELVFVEGATGVAVCKAMMAVHGEQVVDNPSQRRSRCVEEGGGRAERRQRRHGRGSMGGGKPAVRCLLGVNESVYGLIRGAIQ